MRNCEGDSLFSLIGRFVSLVRRFLKQEKAYVKEVGTGALKTGLPVEGTDKVLEGGPESKGRSFQFPFRFQNYFSVASSPGPPSGILITSLHEPSNPFLIPSLDIP